MLNLPCSPEVLVPQARQGSEAQPSMDMQPESGEEPQRQEGLQQQAPVGVFNQFMPYAGLPMGLDMGLNMPMSMGLGMGMDPLSAW